MGPEDETADSGSGIAKRQHFMNDRCCARLVILSEKSIQKTTISHFKAHLGFWQRPRIGGEQEVSIKKALSWPALTGVSWNVPRAPFPETSSPHRLGGGCFALWPKRDCSGGPK